MTNPRLLLADDSVTIRKVIELTFADEGIDVTAVADADSAMAKFLEIHPDIVLVDVGLPGTNGYHICEMIKGDESTAHIPVLLLVGSFEPFDQDAAERSGADGFLTKPFHSIRDLVNRVHELLGTQEQKPIDIGDADISFETTSPTSDTEDIEDLYEQSFAETVQIDDNETIAFTTEEAFPDEQLAETSEPLAQESEPVDASHHSVDQWLDDEMIETVRSEPEEVKDEQPVTAYENGSAPDGIDETGDAKEQLPEETDEVPEQAEGSTDDSEQAPEEVEEAPEEEAIDAISEYEDAPAAAVDIEPIKEFDWSPAAIVTAADEREIGAAAGFSPAFISEESLIDIAPVRQEHVTEEYPDPRTTEVPELAGDDGNASMQTDPDAVAVGESLPAASPELDPATHEKLVKDTADELIEVIVKKVIDRLSDKTIREVAQEAVPRIAEQLMREALEEERQRNG